MKNFIGDNVLTGKEDCVESWRNILFRTTNYNDSILCKDGTI